MIAGLYGFDDVYEYCWYKTRNIPDKTVLLRVILTYDIWVFITLLYLVIAVTLITYSLFSPRGPLSGIGASHYLAQNPQTRSVSSTNITATLAATLARRDLARRALTARVLGYIIVPVICVAPGVIAEVIARSRPDITIPSLVTLITASTAGLMGTFNTIVLSFDPSVVAVVFARRIHERREPRSRTWVPRRKVPVLDEDVEMKFTGPIEESRAAEIRFIPLDTANNQTLEYREQSMSDGVLDDNQNSTVTQNTSELAETYHGL